MPGSSLVERTAESAFPVLEMGAAATLETAVVGLHYLDAQRGVAAFYSLRVRIENQIVQLLC